MFHVKQIDARAARAYVRAQSGDGYSGPHAVGQSRMPARCRLDVRKRPDKTNRERAPRPVDPRPPQPPR